MVALLTYQPWVSCLPMSSLKWVELTLSRLDSDMSSYLGTRLVSTAAGGSAQPLPLYLSPPLTGATLKVGWALTVSSYLTVVPLYMLPHWVAALCLNPIYCKLTFTGHKHLHVYTILA